MPPRFEDTKEHQELGFGEKTRVGTLHATSLQALVLLSVFDYYITYFSKLRKLIFFVYPGPKGSEEPSTKCELDEVKINLLPLGMG
jgi:hypothetical protein